MERKVENVLWFLTGAALGAGIALLYAPQSGEETRRYIREKAGDAKDALAEAGERIAEKSREICKKSAELANDAAGVLERGRKAIGV